MASTLLPRSIMTSRMALSFCSTGAPYSIASFSFTSTVLRASRPLSTSSTTAVVSRARVSPKSIARTQTQVRHVSAAPTQPLATSQGSSSSTTSTNPLTWDQFFATRSRRRYINMGMGVAFAVAAAIFGSPLIGALDLDTSIAQSTGVDPLIVVIGGSFAVAVAGWFAGRILGGVAFSLYARQGGWQRIFVEKEKSFFDRIKRYRADPTSSSPQNPIPDYYGEKISSVKDYRRWLKDQRAFTKKMYRGVR